MEEMLLERIDKLEQKIDQLIENDNKLNVNYALVAQDISRILAINDQMHDIELQTLSNKERLHSIEEKQKLLDNTFAIFSEKFDKKLVRLAASGWGLLLIALTQLIYFIFAIIRDKIIR